MGRPGFRALDGLEEKGRRLWLHDGKQEFCWGVGGRGLEGKRETRSCEVQKVLGGAGNVCLPISICPTTSHPLSGSKATPSQSPWAPPPRAPLPRVADEHICLPPLGGSKGHRPSSAPWDRQPSTPPLLLPPAVPWPSYPETAAACLGDPQARNYYRAMPLDPTTKIRRRRRRCGRRQGGQGLKTSSGQW